MSDDTLARLRRQLAAHDLWPRDSADANAQGQRIALRAAGLDSHLDGGLLAARLHEFYAAAEADVAALAGFALAAAACGAAGRPLVRVRQDYLDREAGRVHPPGLAEIGLDPAALILVRARDAADALQAGLEAARCPAVGIVLLELWGETRALDLTASRRLSLAAQGSGATVLLTRVAAAPAPSAAETRWRVRAAPSRALPANAPGFPAFAITLLRRRGGAAGAEWVVEWDRDGRRFRERPFGGGAALSRPLAALPADRPAAPADDVRRAG